VVSVRQMRGLRACCFACLNGQGEGREKKGVAESDSGPNLLRHPAATVAETADVGALNHEELLYLDHSL